MAAKLYTIVFRYAGGAMQQHCTYSKEQHEKMLAFLRKRKCHEIIEVKDGKGK